MNIEKLEVVVNFSTDCALKTWYFLLDMALTIFENKVFEVLQVISLHRKGF